ncbi:DUF3768 domain-containing protein [Candidatus Saccharibacteria bacterium]|nr:DUF3768 domain-containing protein [Candidatus Saccharibacteria bacterium]
METEQAAKVAALNDAFRATGQGVTITPGVQALLDLHGLLEAVRHFEAWTEGNDPYGEHDFGQFEWGSEKVFWKLDYYDQDLRHWEDPLSPRCRRILTLMLASEY